MTDVALSPGRFSLGRVFGQMGLVFGREWQSLGALGILFGFLPTFIFGALRVSGVVPDPGDDPLAAFRGAPGERLVVGVCDVLLTGAVLTGALSVMAGRNVNLSEMLNGGSGNFWRLVGINILVTLATAVGLFLLIVPGIYIYLRWMVATAVRVAETQGVTQSMGRSAELTEGHRWALFGLMLIAIVAIVIGAVLVNIPLFVLDEGSRTAFALLNLLIEPLTGAISTVLLGVGVAAAYDELVRLKGGGVAMAEVFS